MTADPSPPGDLAAAQHAAMRWNAPLSSEHAELLLDRLGLRPGDHVLDLGCGWGELLLRAVQRGGPGTTGTGVDVDAAALARGTRLRRARGLDDRVEFVPAASAAWRQPADRVLCVGASHAWPGVAEALAALAALVSPGGRLLFGEGCWERAPAPAAAAVFGDEVIALTDILEQAREAGWRVLHLSTADQREWDDFEGTWRAGRQQWLLDHPADARAEEVRDTLDAQQREYVETYRGVLGFCYLVLARERPPCTSAGGDAESHVG